MQAPVKADSLASHTKAPRRRTPWRLFYSYAPAIATMPTLITMLLALRAALGRSADCQPATIESSLLRERIEPPIALENHGHIVSSSDGYATGFAYLSAFCSQLVVNL